MKIENNSGDAVRARQTSGDTARSEQQGAAADLKIVRSAVTDGSDEQENANILNSTEQINDKKYDKRTTLLPMGTRLILASSSPRRREMIGRAFPSFETVVREVDESLDDGIHPRDGVRLLAIRKGRAVRDAVGADCIIISADTLVEMDGTALGKPKDRADAHRMLRSLSGRAHNVHTGVAVHFGERMVSGVATTAVNFRRLCDAEIDEYIDSGEPMDKAGAYGIQGGGGRFVSSYDGDIDTVIGLSMKLVYRLIDEITSGAC